MGGSLIQNRGQFIGERDKKKAPVANLTALFAIDSRDRYEGLEVYVVSEQGYYGLIGGTANENWTLRANGGGTGTGVFSPVQDITALKAIDTTSPTTTPNNWVIYVGDEGSMYALDRNSSEAESLPNIVQPTAGVGRWIKEKYVEIESKSSKSVPLGAISNESQISLALNGEYDEYIPPSDFEPNFTNPLNEWILIPIQFDGNKSIILPTNGQIGNEGSFEDGVDIAAGKYDLFIIRSEGVYKFYLNKKGAVKGVIPQLLAATLVSFVADSDTELTVTWTNPDANEDSIDVYIDTVNTFDSGNLQTVNKVSGSTSHQFTGKTQETQYFTQVIRQGDGVTYADSIASNVLDATTPLPTLATPVITVVPDDGQNTLTLSAIDGNATGGILEFHDGDLIWAAVPTWTFPTSPIVHSSLVNGTEYFYRFKVTAAGYNDSAYGTNSGTPTAAAVQLNAPVLSTATVTGMQAISLTFTDTNTSPNEEGVEVRYSEDAGMAGAITGLTFAADSTSGTQTSLSADTFYYFQVRAKGNGSTTSDSDWSNIVGANAKTFIFYDSFPTGATNPALWTIDSNTVVGVANAGDKLVLAHTSGTGTGSGSVESTNLESSTDIFVLNILGFGWTPTINTVSQTMIHKLSDFTDQIKVARLTTNNNLQFIVRDNSIDEVSTPVGDQPQQVKIIYNKTTGDTSCYVWSGSWVLVDSGNVDISAIINVLITVSVLVDSGNYDTYVDYVYVSSYDYATQLPQ